MSPGGAIFFLPIHTRESVFLPHLLATLDSHCHLWATLPRIADQRALRMVTIGQGLRDFRGCCKPAVSGLGGYRPGLPAQRGTEAIQPADYRQPQGASPPPGLRATCDGSRARTQKRGPERAREFGGLSGPGWSECRPPSFSGLFPAASEEWKWGLPSEGSGWLALAPPPQEQVTWWLGDSKAGCDIAKKRRRRAPRRFIWWKGGGRGLAREPSSWLYWHTRPWGWLP